MSFAERVSEGVLFMSVSLVGFAAVCHEHLLAACDVSNSALLSPSLLRYMLMKMTLAKVALTTARQLVMLVAGWPAV